MKTSKKTSLIIIALALLAFLVELATCENADSRKTIEWPPAPLTVRGNFEGLPQGRP
jgi:hypothetical protein